MKMSFSYLLLLCAISMICGSALASAPKVIKLEPYMGSTLAMRAEVNGREGLFQFDTGGGVSIIGSDFAKKIGCNSWGISGFRMTGERLDFQHCDGLQFKTAGISLKAPTVGVLDIMSLLPKGAPHLDGSLGLDILPEESSRSMSLHKPSRSKARIV